MSDDDDATPAAPPGHPGNLMLLGVLADLTLLAHGHFQRLGLLAAELRRQREPASVAWVARLGADLREYHGRAADVAAEMGRDRGNGAAR